MSVIQLMEATGLLYFLIAIPFILIAIAGIVIIVVVLEKNSKFECSECHNIRESKLEERIFANTVLSSKKIYCPVCKKKTWHSRKVGKI